MESGSLRFPSGGFFEARARENPARVPIANATVIRRNGLANNTNHEQSVRL